jgi:hypothetical protein
MELYQVTKYLPYGPKVITFGGSTDEYLFTSTLDTVNIDNVVRFEWKKLVLRSLSDLIVERDGKIDLVELYKIETSFNNPSDYTLGLDHSRIRMSFYDRTHNEIRFEYDTDDNSFLHYPLEEERFYSINYSLVLFEYLFANHYDVYGLIDKGLAIDINKL